jgi:hypothetical protein
MGCGITSYGWCRRIIFPAFLLLLGIANSFAPNTLAQDTKPAQTVVVRAGRLFDPTTGRMLERPVIVIVGNKINSVSNGNPPSIAVELPLDNVVPGHFELATKAELQRFRDYLNDLYEQVRALKKKNETLEQVRHDIHMEKYSDFRQYAKYEATFADNAAVIYQQLQAH